MPQTQTLETKTFLNFINGRHESELSYPGLLELEEGSIINISVLSKVNNVSSGDYQVSRAKPFNQVILCRKGDSVYRLYNCTRLNKK